MTKNPRNFKLSLLVMLLAATWLLVPRSTSGQASDSQEERVVSISIRNDSNTTVTFHLRNKEREWKDFQLGPGSDNPYKNYDQILIATKGGDTVRYVLEEENRYVIYWNEKKGRWDVYKQELRSR